MSTATSGYDELSTWPTTCFRTTGYVPALALEVFDDFLAPLTPPHRGSRDAPSVFQRQHVGERRERIRRRLVVVRVIGRLLVAAGSRTQRRDTQLVHHLLMVLCSRPVFRFGQRCSGLVCEEERSYQDAAHDLHDSRLAPTG